MVMGCDFGQGVLIAPPMPKERFLELLRAAHEQAAARGVTRDSAGHRRQGGRPGSVRAE